MKGGGDTALLITIGSLNQGDIKEESDVLVSQITYIQLYDLIENKESHIFHLFRSTMLQSSNVNHFKVAGWIPTNANVSLRQLPEKPSIFNGISSNGNKAIFWFDSDRYIISECLLVERVCD